MELSELAKIQKENDEKMARLEAQTLEHLKRQEQVRQEAMAKMMNKAVTEEQFLRQQCLYAEMDGENQLIDPNNQKSVETCKNCGKNRTLHTKEEWGSC